MLGFIAGDIVGSPYRQNNTFEEDFGLFDTVVREFYRKKDRDWTRVETEAAMTRNVLPALGVMQWLNYSDGTPEDLVKDLSEARGSLDLGYAPDGDAMAFLPLGLAARDEEHLSELQDTLYEALGKEKGEYLSPEDFKAACFLSEAVFRVKSGLPKRELALWAAPFFEDSVMAQESQVRESSVKEGDVANLHEFSWFFQKDNVKDNSVMRSAFAALYSFLYTDGFEKGLRKAVSMGGCSPTVAGIFGALGQVAYGVTPSIDARASQYLDKDTFRLVRAFEKQYMVQMHYSGALQQVEDEGKAEFETKAAMTEGSYIFEKEYKPLSDNIVELIDLGDGKPIYLVPEEDEKLRGYILKENKTDKDRIRLPEEKASLLEVFAPERKEGTYVTTSRPEVRRQYFSGGKLLSVSGTADKAVKTDLEIRRRVRYSFNELKERVSALKADIFKEFGISEPLDIHFETAAYVEVGKDRICVYQGVNDEGKDNLLGEVRIDDKTGLVRLRKTNEGLENYQEGMFDGIRGELFIPLEVFSAMAKDRAEVYRNYSSEEQRDSHIKAINESLREKMFKMEKYYSIQPLQDVFQCIENTIYDVTTAQDARIDKERMDRNTGSPYDFEGRKTNLDLLNEDFIYTEDPELQGVSLGRGIINKR